MAFALMGQDNFTVKIVFTYGQVKPAEPIRRIAAYDPEKHVIEFFVDRIRATNLPLKPYAAYVATCQGDECLDISMHLRRCVNAPVTLAQHLPPHSQRLLPLAVTIFVPAERVIFR